MSNLGKVQTALLILEIRIHQNVNTSCSYADQSGSRSARETLIGGLPGKISTIEIINLCSRNNEAQRILNPPGRFRIADFPKIPDEQEALRKLARALADADVDSSGKPFRAGRITFVLP